MQSLLGLPRRVPSPGATGTRLEDSSCLTGPPRLLSSEGSGSRSARRPWAWLQGALLGSLAPPWTRGRPRPQGHITQDSCCGAACEGPQGVEKYFLEQSCSLLPACDRRCSRVRTSALQEGGAGRLPCAPLAGGTVAALSSSEGARTAQTVSFSKPMFERGWMSARLLSPCVCCPWRRTLPLCRGSSPSTAQPTLPMVSQPPAPANSQPTSRAGARRQPCHQPGLHVPLTPVVGTVTPGARPELVLGPRHLRGPVLGCVLWAQRFQHPVPRAAASEELGVRRLLEPCHSERRLLAGVPWVRGALLSPLSPGPRPETVGRDLGCCVCACHPG